MHFRSVVQTLSLALFLFLIWKASFPLSGLIPVDLFLRLDPLITTGTILSSREWLWALAPGLIILGLSAVLGRFFCGYICPMGTTLDVGDWLLRSGSRNIALSQEQQNKFRKIKYYILFFIFGAGLSGISWVFSASPLSLITRFYALLVYPVLTFISDGLLDIATPLTLKFGLDSLTYLEPKILYFATQWFIAVFFLTLFLLAFVTPRFWCRYLCPSGALMAIMAGKPFIRRKVSDECTNCGLCIKKCPMNAIPDDPYKTSHQECLACETCVRVCPEQAVSFSFGFNKNAGKSPAFMPSRRKVLISAVAGAGSAVIAHTAVSGVRSDFVPGNIMPESLIRPPGALMERDFQARCIRCGLCMKACPTNTLQPVWFEAGLDGLFSPKVLPRRGPCDPMCNVCGHVCPTGAIRALSLEEKMWARIGTSYVIPYKCLAWEWKRECLVCYEVCPYAAIELKRVEGIGVPVPYVVPHKCSGCGACEYHCPVQARSAIVVEPMEALRMNRGSYIQAGKAIGMELEADPDRQRRPPGHLFDHDDPGDLPPGFTF